MNRFGPRSAAKTAASIVVRRRPWLVDNIDPSTHCETMRNLTVSLDDETYRRARIIAAERDTSVSALVKRFLVELASGESEFERLKREERELREQITDFSASDRLSRDELYDRRR